MESPFKTTGRGLVKTHCTINECAELLSCHRNTVVNYFEKGILTKIKPNGGRHVYIAVEEINRFLSGEDTMKSDVQEEKECTSEISLKLRKTFKLLQEREVSLPKKKKAVKKTQNDKAREAIDKYYGKVEPIEEEIKKRVAKLKATKFLSKPKKRFRKKSTSDFNYEKQSDFEKKQLMDKRIKEKRAKRELERKKEYPSMTRRSPNRIINKGSWRACGVVNRNSLKGIKKGRRYND